MTIAMLFLTEESGAQDSVCELVSVEPSPDLDPSWLPAVERLRATLAHELSASECIAFRLRVEPRRDGVFVRVQAGDGRETLRLVRDERALVPVVLGLLAGAPQDHPVPRRQTPTDGDTDARDLPDFSVPKPEKKAAPSPVGLALALSTGIRFGLPTDVTMWDTEIRADVLLHDWSILAFMRYAPFGAVSAIATDADAYEEIGVGFGVGRELRWGRHTLDLSLSPSIVFVSMEIDSPLEKSGELADLRINGAARYGYSLGGGWRFTLTVDTEGAPNSLLKVRYPNPALPAVPAWTLGLRLGAAASLL